MFRKANTGLAVLGVGTLRPADCQVADGAWCRPAARGTTATSAAACSATTKMYRLVSEEDLDR